MDEYREPVGAAITATEAVAIRECLQTAIAATRRMASIARLLRKLDSDGTGELDDYHAYRMLLDDAELTINVLLAAVEGRLTRLLGVDAKLDGIQRELSFSTRAARLAAG